MSLLSLWSLNHVYLMDVSASLDTGSTTSTGTTKQQEGPSVCESQQPYLGMNLGSASPCITATTRGLAVRDGREFIQNGSFSFCFENTLMNYNGCMIVWLFFLSWKPSINIITVQLNSSGTAHKRLLYCILRSCLNFQKAQRNKIWQVMKL